MFSGAGSTKVDYHTCRGCGFTKKSPIPAGLDEYYRSSWMAPERPHGDASEWLLESMEANCVRPLSAIDVGARDDAFVRLLGCEDTSIFDPQISGGFVGTEGFTPPGKYDLVCTQHVLEHVEDVRAFMEDLKAMASGLIFIEVPSPELETLAATNDDIARTHLQHFTLNSLIGLAFNHGLYVLRADFQVGDGLRNNRVLLSVTPPRGVDVIRGVHKNLRAAYSSAAEVIFSFDPSTVALYGKSDGHFKLRLYGGERIDNYAVFDRFRGTLDGIDKYDAVALTPRGLPIRKAIKEDLDAQGVKWIDPWDQVPQCD
jgi:hypothetical protein